VSFSAVVLAGGAGARFGGGKLLASYQGGALLDGALRAAFAAPAAEVVLATGHDGDRVAAAAAVFADRLGEGARLRRVHAPDHAEGMAATLRAAVAGLSDRALGAFVFLADMPRVPADVPARLAAALGERAAAAPAFDGRRGHPVLVARRLFPALARLRGDQGARALLEGLGADLVLVPVEDAGVLFDVDRPTDLGVDLRLDLEH
jgi:molybdenum cofactor cytidylyltransferase